MKRRRIVGWLGLIGAIALPITWWGRQQISQRTIADSSIAVFPTSKQAPAASLPLTLTPADEAEIIAVIQQQLAAFQANNADLAFSFASPGIQDQFQTAEQFMVMVQSMYEPVYRPQSVDFGELALIRGNPVQAVTVLGPAGALMTAYYQMEQQSDDSWRIAGCFLVPAEGKTI
ncbi:MAG: DUF4864 domain-containing protein [Leptolyngbyaceae cyanobacterium]